MRFLVTFPISDKLLYVMRVTMNAVYKDHILAGWAKEIETLRIAEHMLINNRYLVVRIQ